MTAADATPGGALAKRHDGVLTVSGDLTFATVPELVTQSEAWLAAGTGALTVDLGGVRRADSAGLALMVEWLRLAREGARELKFVHMPDQVRNFIHVSGLTQVLPAD